MNRLSFIWNVAESLRGPFKPAEYGSVVLAFAALRGLDAVLADTKRQVIDAVPGAQGMPDVLRDVKVREASGDDFYNASPFTMAKLVADPAGLRGLRVH